MTGVRTGGPRLEPPPASDGARRAIASILAAAGVEVGGGRPWDLQVHDPRFFRRVLAEGSLGLGESYMDGWWDVEDLAGLATRLFASRADERLPLNWTSLWAALRARLFNLQRSPRARRRGGLPYRFGDALFLAMLDRRLCYSCAYFKDTDDLDAAQEAKLDLVCRKLGLEPGMRVLDVGCGWGSFVAFAAERYRVAAVGITVSEDQARLARERCAGLDVEIRLQDYRDLGGERFDRVASIGMFEHVGFKNFRRFMTTMAGLLGDDGLLLLHTIGRNRSTTTLEPWVEKYVFPDCMLPSAAQLAAAIEGVFVLEDWHNFGADYDRTLVAWWERFDRAWPAIRDALGYDERFRRMWRFYLLGCVGRFRTRRNQLWQLVLSPNGVAGGYPAVR